MPNIFRVKLENQRQKNLKEVEDKKAYYFQRNVKRLAVGFSTVVMEQWNVIFYGPKENNCHSRIIYIAKMCFTNE